MKKWVIVLFFVCAGLLAEDPSVPAPRTKHYFWMSVDQWKDKHANFVKRAKEGKIDLLFLGDSITEQWNNNAVWQKNYTPLNAANFGIGGDVVQNVLWRITTGGEVEGLSPKVAVLMIGTNNFGLHGDKEEDVAKGVTTLVQAIRTKLPGTKVLLLGIFPRDQKPTSPFRAKIKAVNDVISKLDDGKMIRYLDIGPKLANADGSLDAAIMPDFLHLTIKGYEIWTDSMAPLLAEMMK